MKRSTLLLTLTAAVAFGLTGCSKNETSTTATDDANKTAEAAKVEAAKTTEAANVEAAKAAETAKVEAARVAEAAKVEAAKAADIIKAQGFIDKAKNLIAEGKLTDASKALQQLTGLTLTDDQKKIVDGMKDQIQKALAAKAAAAAAGAGTNLIK